MHARFLADESLLLRIVPLDAEYALLAGGVAAHLTGRTLLESKDASGREHKDKGPGGGQFTHGQRAAALHEKGQALAKAHAEHQAARREAFDAVKAEAAAARDKADEHAGAISELHQQIPWDADTDKAFNDLEAAVSEYDDGGTPGEQFGKLKEIESAANNALRSEQELTKTPDEARQAKVVEREIAGIYPKLDEVSKKLQGEFPDEASMRVVQREKQSLYDRLNELKNQDDLNRMDVEAGLLPEEVAANKKHLAAIITHARAARQQLKAYVSHRKEMAAIKSGEPMELRESVESMDDAAFGVLLLEHATAHKPPGSPDGGQFTSGDGSSSGADDGGPDHFSAAARVQHAAHATHEYLHSKAAAGFARLPTPVQKVVSGALAVAFSGWTASQKIAERISIEKGSTPEEAAKLRSTLAAWDVIAFKPMAFATAPLGGAVAAASWIVPPVTGVYLAHSAMMHPLASYRAAKGLIKDAMAATKKVVADHTAKL